MRIRARLFPVAALVGLLLVGGVAAWAATLAIKSPPVVQTQFGYIKPLVQKGTSYQLRLNPAFFLQGETANQAAIAAGVIKPGQTIDNDYYIVKVPGNVVLTYKVPAGTPVTVLTNNNRSTKITVKQLAQILKGTSPLKPKLMDPGTKFFFGYWLRLKVDTVISIDQQFQP